ncbi:hypothetical protein GCM10027570_08580 [Streptomonospora sediminis]
MQGQGGRAGRTVLHGAGAGGIEQIAEGAAPGQIVGGQPEGAHLVGTDAHRGIRGRHGHSVLVMRAAVATGCRHPRPDTADTCRFPALSSSFRLSLPCRRGRGFLSAPAHSVSA